GLKASGDNSAKFTPYRLEPLEVLQIHVADTLPNQPIQGLYTISPEGLVTLGYSYGSVRVAGLTLDQATQAIRKHLGAILRDPQVRVQLLQFRQRWEYKTASGADLRKLGQDDMEAGLNKLGDEGWELVGITKTFYIFKRPRRMKQPAANPALPKKIDAG